MQRDFHRGLLAGKSHAWLSSHRRRHRAHRRAPGVFSPQRGSGVGVGADPPRQTRPGHRRVRGRGGVLRGAGATVATPARPIGRVGFAPAARATAIGFAITAVLPGRLGEVLRPYLLARRERLSASAALATIVLERLLDVIAVAFLFGVFLLFFSGDLQQTDPQVLTALTVGGLVAAIGATTVLALIVVAAYAPDRVAGVVAQVERRLPQRVGAAAGRFIIRFSAGLGIARQPGRFIRAFAWSFPVWLSVCVSAWCVCQAFGIALPPGGSLLLMMLMVLGVSVPTPAGVGGFHAAFQVGVTSFYAAPVDAAVGAALVLHALSFGPVTLLGIVWMARDGLTLRSAVDLASSGGMANGSGTEPVGVSGSGQE